MATISVSVVIPCYNEEKYIGSLLDDLTKQTVLPAQVIVADCRSTDGTVGIAKQYIQKLPMSVVTSDVRSPGGARNAGARIATGGYILFSDADNHLPPDTIERFSQAAEEKGVDYVSPLFSSPSTRWFDRRVMHGINRFITSASAAKKFVPGIGGCMFVRRTVHETSGGFDTQLQTEEDMFYLRKLKQQNTSYAILDDFYIETSDRRVAVDGRLSIALNFIPKDSWIGRHITYPLLRRVGKDKRYGIF